mmetsp:Transcript_106203/g.274666  ORF Transcript_106203/g.274666 Transcript_106203/m.274666 type:complete len:83 (+) Transcript_106203:671-919(+)
MRSVRVYLPDISSCWHLRLPAQLGMPPDRGAGTISQQWHQAEAFLSQPGGPWPHDLVVFCWQYSYQSWPPSGVAKVLEVFLP